MSDMSNPQSSRSLPSDYLQTLTIKLAQGIGKIPEDVRDRHAQFLLDQQKPDGGFGGRMGDSDMYYTAFALRALSILGMLYGDRAERACDFIRSRLDKHETIVDFFSLIYAASLLRISAGIDPFDSAGPDWQSQVAGTLNKLRRDDGGFAKGFEGKFGSTYHTFLVVLCLQLIEVPVDAPEKIVDFLVSREDEEGGFHEIKASKRPGTNPTAAGVATLRILDSMTDYIQDGVIDFLLDMQTEEGGLRANTRMPIADILSTFTGLLTLTDLGAIGEANIDAAREFVEQQQMPGGGFRAASWDEVADVEYTFYGLGSMALLALASDAK